MRATARKVTCCLVHIVLLPATFAPRRTDDQGRPLAGKARAVEIGTKEARTICIKMPSPWHRWKWRQGPPTKG
eukprot:13086619-Alexandrium_andersonii.AAC.1